MLEVFENYKVWDCWAVDRYTSSEGNVSSFRFALLPLDGYRQLVQASLDELPGDAEVVDWILDRPLADLDLFVARAAIESLRESFRKTLAKPFDPGESPPERIVDTPEGVCVYGVEVDLPPPSKKAVKPETIARDAVRRVLPVARYVHLLVFRHEKNYDAIRKIH